MTKQLEATIVFVEEREEWEGDDPRYCMEPLQPNPRRVIHEDEMMQVQYEEDAA